MVAGEIGPEDLQLAVELGLPIMGEEPEVAMLHSTKIGSKRIFSEALVASPPGIRTHVYWR